MSLHADAFPVAHARAVDFNHSVGPFPSPSECEGRTLLSGDTTQGIAGGPGAKRLAPLHSPDGPPSRCASPPPLPCPPGRPSPWHPLRCRSVCVHPSSRDVRCRSTLSRLGRCLWIAKWPKCSESVDSTSGRCDTSAAPGGRDGESFGQSRESHHCHSQCCRCRAAIGVQRRRWRPAGPLQRRPLELRDDINQYGFDVGDHHSLTGWHHVSRSSGCRAGTHQRGRQGLRQVLRGGCQRIGLYRRLHNSPRDHRSQLQRLSSLY